MTADLSAELGFADFSLRIHERQLIAKGEPVPLGARAFDVLVVLVQHAGELVSKALLLERVWPGLIVEENNLQVHVSTLRKVLGAELIATVPGRGYRFTARVKPLEPEPGTAPAPLLIPTSGGAAPHSRASRSLAVLRFANLSDDPTQEYFSDGVAEDIISKLTRSRWLFVIARNSSFSVRPPIASTAAVCKQLDCHYLVSGTVRRSGTSVRVTAELVDGDSGETLWAQRYDRPLDDLFNVQNDISAAIVSAIEPVYLRREEYRTSQRETPNMAHWELLMRARWHFWRTSRKHNDEAQKLLTQALAIKPEDSSCLSLMAFTHMSRVWAGWAPDPKAEIIEANRLALRAIRHDDTDSYAHFTLGTALSFTGNIPQAIAELEYALTLYPQFAAAAGELGRLLAFSGRTNEAVEYVLQAIDASPHDPHLSLWVRSRAIACYIDEDYAQAVKYAQQATANRANWFFNYYLLAACQVAAGDSAAAVLALEQAKPFGPYSPSALRFGHPFVDARQMERFIGHLRSAGWADA